MTKQTEQIHSLSDHELYLLARKLSEGEFLGFARRSKELDAVCDECVRREKPEIFENAQSDAIQKGYALLENIYNIENQNYSNIKTKPENLKRIDFMNPEEIMQELCKFNGLQVIDVEPRQELLADIAKFAARDNFFICEARGASMLNAGIVSGAKLLVEKTSSAMLGDTIIAQIEDELLVKKYDGNCLKSANDCYPDIPIPQGCCFQIWGVVRLIIQKPT